MISFFSLHRCQCSCSLPFTKCQTLQQQPAFHQIIITLLQPSCSKGWKKYGDIHKNPHQISFLVFLNHVHHSFINIVFLEQAWGWSRRGEERKEEEGVCASEEIRRLCCSAYIVQTFPGITHYFGHCAALYWCYKQ